MSLRTPRLRHTLAFRLTLWYAGIFALSSCIAFLLFYTLITSVIRERTDQELAGQVRRFARARRGRYRRGHEGCGDRGPGGRREEGILSPALSQRRGVFIVQYGLLAGHRVDSAPSSSCCGAPAPSLKPS